LESLPTLLRHHFRRFLSPLVFLEGIIERTEGRLFQVDGSVNPGNSGGPVINERGHVLFSASSIRPPGY
jgi:S1-C subfamily serine protease